MQAVKWISNFFYLIAYLCLVLVAFSGMQLTIHHCFKMLVALIKGGKVQIKIALVCQTAQNPNV